MSQHIVVDRVTKQFDLADEHTLALDDVSLTIEANEFVSIVAGHAHVSVRRGLGVA